MCALVTGVQTCALPIYTISMVNVPGFYCLPLYKPTQYKPEDLRLIARVVEDPIVIYAKRDSDVPKTLSGIVEALKKKPESLSFGHSGDELGRASCRERVCQYV